MDIGSPIDFTYELPFAFTGTIHDVTIELGPTDIGKPQQAPAAAARREPAKV